MYGGGGESQGRRRCSGGGKGEEVKGRKCRGKRDRRRRDKKRRHRGKRG